ncbi:hypothetical protein ES703_77108 [subsurface metagenome]
MKVFGVLVIVAGISLTIFNALRAKYLIENQAQLIQTGNMTSNEWMFNGWFAGILLFIGLLVAFGGLKLITHK